MGNVSRYRTVIVHSMEEMNGILENAEYYTRICKHGVKNYRVASQVEVAESRVSLFTQWGASRSSTKTEYQFWLDGTERFVGDPALCYTEFVNTENAYQKFKKIDEMDDYIQSMIPYDDKNEKYTMSARPMLKKFYSDYFEGNVWVYDLNSAYAWAAMQDQPDTTKDYLKDCEVPEGYVGFLLDSELTMIEAGGYAEIAFPLMESPFKKYMKKWYEKKRNATTKEEKATAKQHLLIPIGFLQKSQPFIRANIVHSINYKMARLCDKDTIYVNTDAIYSKVPRYDLEMGEDIGQFKVEKTCKARLKGFCIQYLNEDGTSDEVKYRGVGKARFGKDYNLLTDGLPEINNIYRYNEKINRIEEICDEAHNG